MREGCRLLSLTTVGRWGKLTEMLGQRYQIPTKATCQMMVDGSTAATNGAIDGDRHRRWEVPMKHLAPAQFPSRVIEQKGFG